MGGLGGIDGHFQFLIHTSNGFLNLSRSLPQTLSNYNVNTKEPSFFKHLAMPYRLHRTL